MLGGGYKAALLWYFPGRFEETEALDCSSQAVVGDVHSGYALVAAET